MPKGSWREFDDPEEKSIDAQLDEGLPKAQRQVRVKRIKGGKAGKTITLITGLELDAFQARSLLKRLKTRCGTGGTVKGDSLELQGDKVIVVLELLRNEGYSPKQSGG